MVNKTKKIYLDFLPKYYSRKGFHANKLIIDWKNSINHIVHFIYNDIEGDIQITNYNSKKQMLTILYKYLQYNITTGNFSKCQLGSFLGTHSTKFKIEIGTTFEDSMRNFIILDREYRPKVGSHGYTVKEKWYKYKCNICGWDNGWILEDKLIKGDCCNCCCSRTVVEGINDIPTTVPWMIPYFQGGYNEAKLYTKASSKKIYAVCPDCGRIKNKLMKISTMLTTHSIGCSCGDGQPYPEKFIHEVIKQLNLCFQTQLNKSIFKWCQNYKYDFYFEYNNEQYICEVNGEQHYKDTSGIYKKTLKEEQENDRLKKEIAIQNGIKPENYIVIDCRKSELEWIRDNKDGILNSRLNELFNLNNINWNKCEEFALSNKVKEACEIKRNNPNLLTTEIGKIMNLQGQTIRKYLIKGSKIWDWCYYNPKEEIQRRQLKNKGDKKPIMCIENGMTFESLTDCSNKSLEIFGTKLSAYYISLVCKGEKENYKGYNFKYIK